MDVPDLKISRDVPSTQRRTRTYLIGAGSINPFVRIAHRVKTPMWIAARIIFDHEIVLILSGAAAYIHDGEASTLRAGDLIFIQPFRPHEFRPVGDGGCEHVAVHFDLAPGVPSFEAEPSRRRAYRVQLTDGLAIRDRLDRSHTGAARDDLLALLTAWESHDAAKMLAVKARLLSVLLQLVKPSRPPADAEGMAAGISGGITAGTTGGIMGGITGGAAADGSAGGSARRCAGARRNQLRMERVLSYIDQHLHEPLDVPSLAEAMNLSVTHLNRLFRKHVGRSPMDHLRRVRLDRARRLLAEVDLSIKEIALRCGFSDPYHFSRTFHRFDGLSPSLYREAVLAGQATSDSSVGQNG